MVQKDPKTKDLKIFFIKLISIVAVTTVALNLLFNSIFSERLERIDKILFLNKGQSHNDIKEKIREELRDGLNNENLLAEEDKILLYKLYLKLQKEFEDLEKENF